MPRPRFARLDTARRNALLDVAAEEFAAHGFAGASLNRVIEAAAISKGVFYYYFDDKSDLLATVIERSWEVLLPDEPLDLEELEADTFWATVERLFLEVAARTQQYPWLAGIAKLIYHPPPSAGVEDVVAAQLGRARGWLGNLLARGQELGVVRSDLPGGLLLAMTIAASEAADRWLVHHWQEVDPRSFEDVAHRLFATMQRIVTPGPGGGRAP
jgi:AcrR family transcriptional regulator